MSDPLPDGVYALSGRPRKRNEDGYERSNEFSFDAGSGAYTYRRFDSDGLTFSGKFCVDPVDPNKIILEASNRCGYRWDGDSYCISTHEWLPADKVSLAVERNQNAICLLWDQADAFPLRFYKEGTLPAVSPQQLTKPRGRFGTSEHWYSFSSNYDHGTFEGAVYGEIGAGEKIVYHEAGTFSLDSADPSQVCLTIERAYLSGSRFKDHVKIDVSSIKDVFRGRFKYGTLERSTDGSVVKLRLLSPTNVPLELESELAHGPCWRDARSCRVYEAP